GRREALIPRWMSGDVLISRKAHLNESPAILIQLAQVAGQHLCITGLRQKADRAVADDLVSAARRGRNDRQAAAHRFEVSNAERLVTRRHDQNVAAIEIAGYLFVRHSAEHLDI